MDKLDRSVKVVKFPAFGELLLIFFEYCWAFVIILNGNSVYHANALKNYRLLELSVIVTVLLLAAYLALGRIRIKKRNVAIAAGLCLYSLVYFAVQQNKMTAVNFLYLFVIGLPCLFLLFAEMHRRGRLVPLLCRMANVVCVFGAMSLFFWTLGTALGILKPNMTTRINWGYFDTISGYWGLHFQIQRDTTFGTWMYRNSGIFAEAPMLNMWCCIALAAELFLREKPSWFRGAVLIVTIFTAMSTTGIIFIALCFGLKLCQNFKKTKRLTRILLLLAAAVVIPAAGYVVYEVMLLKADTQSFAMRMSDYTGPIRLWMNYPLFGSGYANLRSLIGYVYSPDGVVGFSNSIVAVLSTGGAWMAVLFYYPHIASMFGKFTKNKGISFFCICFFYLFCTTSFFARYIAVVMVAFGLAVLLEPEAGQTTPKPVARG